MINRLLERGLLDAETPTERAIREHSSWLTRAVAAWKSGQDTTPRIPVREVSEGGFSELVASPTGRAWADRWWESTLVGLDACR